MKIIEARLREMPSSLLAELGSYRYGVFAREEGWSIPSRLSTPGQEFDRYDRSDVIWLIAWSAQHGICGCARLMPWQDAARHRVLAPGDVLLAAGQQAWEMSRFSARMDIDKELPLALLWHAVQLASQSGIHCLFSAATPLLENLFEAQGINFDPLPPGIIQSEDNLFAVKIPLQQPQLREKFNGAPRFRPEEVLPSLGVSASWGPPAR